MGIGSTDIDMTVRNYRPSAKCGSGACTWELASATPIDCKLHVQETGHPVRLTRVVEEQYAVSPYALLEGGFNE